MPAIFRSPKVAHSSTCAIFSMKFTIFLLSFSRLVSSNLTDFALVGFLVYSRAIPMSFFGGTPLFVWFVEKGKHVICKFSSLQIQFAN